MPERGRTHRRASSSDDYSDVAASLQALTEISPDSPEFARLREQVITRCLPLAEHIAMRFRGRGEPHEDLLQVARIGLVNAIDRFDITRGGDFVSYAVPTIMGEVRRYFRDSGWAMRVPRRMKELHLMIARSTEVLSQRLGRAPTARELSVELGISVQEVSEGLLVKGAYHTDSMDAAVFGEDGGLRLSEVLGAEDPELQNVDGYVALQPLLAQLPDRERRILLLRFFGSMTQTQIAERVGMSQMHVSRILARTLEQLREALRQ
ncbi:SigB/SigF/SigG family RNA polymerase sigma factor [Tomitella biformata]|uniref:SigB/SigF/SigG family RNA polymerase sigma factor n=1 Tax=Tomitella biformata TaxID=630403 RepID=UPI0004630DC0